MKFSKGRCRVLSLGKNNLSHQDKVQADLVGSRSAEKDLGALVDNKLSQQWFLVAKKSSGILDALGRAFPAG